MSTEAAILKNLFPPAGAVPLACIDRIDKIRAHIQAAIELADGSQPATLGRICNPVNSEALTMRIVALKESPEGAALCWREIGARIGITADAASKRYQKFCKTREAEELRREGYEALSGDHIVEADEMIAAAAQDGKQQEMEQVPGRAELREPKPTDEEKATIRESRIVEDSSTVAAPPAPPGGAERSPESPAEQSEEGAKEFAEAVRLRVLQLYAEGKPVKEIADILGVRWQWVRGVCDHANRAPAGGPASKPEPKSIARAELDARIWAAWKAGKTLEEISNELYAEGLYYSEKSVRVRLISQGADI